VAAGTPIVILIAFVIVSALLVTAVIVPVYVPAVVGVPDSVYS
jgi:hypothetical protein